MPTDQALLPLRSQRAISAQVGAYNADARPLVIIVDDDASVREGLAELVLSIGLETRCFASARELLESDAFNRPGCLVLDIRMPGASGLDFQAQLARNGNPKPIVFITGHGDIPMTVQAMKAGAIDFLTKPVRDQTLLDAVLAGIEKDIALRAKARLVSRHVDCVEKLTPREREVFGHVARGRLNKQIAYELGISEVTVKLHRGNVMRKLEVGSIGALIRIWESLPISIRDKE